MRLDLGQTAERLGITKDGVRKLEDAGKLTNVRPVKEGAGKVYRLYDSAAVNALKKTGDYTPKRAWTNHNGVHQEPATKPNGTPASGFIARLERMEHKIDQLLALWR